MASYVSATALVDLEQVEAGGLRLAHALLAVSGSGCCCRQRGRGEPHARADDLAGLDAALQLELARVPLHAAHGRRAGGDVEEQHVLRHGAFAPGTWPCISARPGMR
jgi:hypothetical protein